MSDISLDEQIKYVEKLRKRQEMSGDEVDNLVRRGYRPADDEIMYKSKSGEMYEAILKSLQSLLTP